VVLLVVDTAVAKQTAFVVEEALLWCFGIAANKQQLPSQLALWPSWLAPRFRVHKVSHLPSQSGQGRFIA